MKNFVRSALLLTALSCPFVSFAGTTDCSNPCDITCDETSCGGKFNVGADYLYWKTKQDDLTAFFIDQSTNINNDTITLNNPRFSHESGFRVYAGYEFPCTEWQVEAIYTYAPGKGHYKHLVAGEKYNIDFFNISKLSGHWTSVLSYLDLEAARTIHCGDYFDIRPHMGVRLLWGDQRQFIDGLLVPDNDGVTTDLFDLERNKQKYHGYGIEGGLWTEWHVWCNVSFVGHFGGSIISLKERNHNSYISRLSDGSGSSIDTDTTVVKNRLDTYTPSLDAYLGIKYHANFCSVDVNAKLGWESHLWFDLGRVTLIDTGNLGMHGLTAGLDVSF